MRVGIAIAVIFSSTRAAFAQPTCPGSDAIVLDCNGNGTDDFCDVGFYLTSLDVNTNGIPDECDVEECFALWSGFEPVPPFSVGTFIHQIDFDGDGDAWDNPSNSWSIVNQGCPSAGGKAVKGVSQIPPTTDYVDSELFRTESGRLDCGAAIWTLNFDARSEAQLNPRIDWQMMVRDATNEMNVVQLHWASTQSSFAGVTTAQGGNGRGRMLVKNPSGSPAFINSGFALTANTCYQVRLELSNVTGEVALFVNGVLRVTTTRLDATAARLDYFRVQQVANGQAAGGINRLALDNAELCQIGRALEWPDCNTNCVSDEFDVMAGTSADCDSSGTPDECEADSDCNTNGVPDICDVAAGTSQDCDSNGVPNECDPDCNTNGIPDGCDIAAGVSADCNSNGRLDVCDLAADFNGDAVFDGQDWSALVPRFFGPDTAVPCPLFDLDADGDIDFFDAAAFLALFTGPDSDGDRIPDLFETDDGVFISTTATGTNPALADTDRDGLSDGDEVYGTPAGLDLPALGASPFRRDIFIEVDWTDDSFDIGSHSHRPTDEIVEAIAGAFAAAPVTNPYAAPDGVTLHVDYGQGGEFTGGNLIPGGPAFISFGFGFNTFKATHFASQRKGYFHYAIFTHRYNSSTNGSSGVAEIFGDDFMVTLPFSPQHTSSVSKTMMHELGHNLNLRHGGDVNLNQKPNYNSVMNYRFQFPGIDSDCDAFGDGVPDYSRGLLPSIDENHLNECNGTCGPGFPIDWNFSGGPCEADVASNITLGEDGDDLLSMLHDFDDWSSIVFVTLQGGDRSAPEIVMCQDGPLP